jgi:drug/metabolite transporter (DMT)-like permease
MWMAAAATCFAITFGFIRALSETLHTFEIVLLRNLLGMLFLLPWLARAGLGALKTTRWKGYSLRAVTGYAAMACWFYALSAMPLGEASALQFTMPLWAIILAVLFLRERANAARWIATIVGFAGVLVVIRPGIIDTSLAALAALAAAALYSGNNIITKTLTRSDDPTAVTFHSFLFSLPFALPPALMVRNGPGWAEAPLILGFGLSTIGAHITLTRALSIADASVVGPVDYLRLPVVVAIGFVFFDEFPDLWTWVGAAIIVASTWYLTVRETRENHRG